MAKQSIDPGATAPKAASGATTTATRPDFAQTVLVLQGGGALGSYQVGVYQALHEAGIEPDWVIGTSIGAINASLIAGNPRDSRLDKLAAFWKRVEHSPHLTAFDSLPGMAGMLPMWSTLSRGIPGFFQPNPFAFFGLGLPLSPESAGYYSISPLSQTLSELVDFSLLNSGRTRLTVGAANVRTSAMRYFDSRDTDISVQHILASGALPPAFPAVRIDGDLYWDGGILSNTPVEAVFDDNPRRNSLVFAVHLWNPDGDEPATMRDVMHRQKDLQYCSRAVSHILRQKQMHRLRHIIAELSLRLPEADRAAPEIAEMAAYGCLTQMHVIRLVAPQLKGEDHNKDVDFSAAGISKRCEAGYADTRRVLDRRPWEGEFDPLDGFVLHEVGDSPLPGGT